MKPIIVIPALNPDGHLLSLMARLRQLGCTSPVVVVDDGSGEDARRAGGELFLLVEPAQPAGEASVQVVGLAGEAVGRFVRFLASPLLVAGHSGLHVEPVTLGDEALGDLTAHLGHLVPVSGLHVSEERGESVRDEPTDGLFLASGEPRQGAGGLGEESGRSGHGVEIGLRRRLRLEGLGRRRGRAQLGRRRMAWSGSMPSGL